MSSIDWRKLEAKILDLLRQQDCEFEEDDLSDITTRYVNVSRLARDLCVQAETKHDTTPFWGFIMGIGR